MMRNYFYLIISLFLLLIYSGTLINAQQRVFIKEQDNVSYVFDFDRTATGDAVYLNRMIQALDRGIPKPLNQIRYVIRADYKLQVSIRSRGKYDVNLDFESFHLSGDIVYKGFSVSNELKPAALGGAISLYGRRGEEISIVMHTRHFTGIPFSLSAGFENDTIDIRRAKLDELNYVYDSRSLNRLNNKIRLIDDYYLADGQLNHIMYSLNRINPLELERLDQNIRIFDEAEALIDQLHAVGFPQYLNLSLYDPIQFLPRFHAAANMAERVAGELSKVAANLDEMYYDRGMKSFNSGEYTQAIHDFSQAIRFNEKFHRARLKLGLSQLAVGDSIGGISNLVEIANAEQVVPSDRNKAFEELKLFYDTKIHHGEEQLAAKNYQAAYNTFHQAGELCHIVNGLSCTRALQSGLGRAVEEIFSQKLAKAKQRSSEQQFNEAEALLSDIESFRNKYPDISRAQARINDAKKVVHQNWYDDEMESARNRFDNERYDRALELLESAEKRAETHNLLKANDWNKLAVASAESYVIQKSEQGIEMADENELRGAERLLSDIQRVSSRYRIQQKESIKEAENRLAMAIEDRACLNANNAVNLLLDKASTYESEQNFINARRDYEQAILVGRENEYCDLNLEFAENQLNRIAPFATYQVMRNDVHKHIRARRYQEAVELYLESGVFHSENELTLGGIEHMPVLEFLKHKGHQQFSEASIAYFIGHDMHDEALEMLQYFAVNRVRSNSNIRGLQRELGSIFAQRDFYLNPPPNPRQHVQRYTLDERRLRFLRRSYMRTWRSL